MQAYKTNLPIIELYFGDLNLKPLGPDPEP